MMFDPLPYTLPSPSYQAAWVASVVCSVGLVVLGGGGGVGVGTTHHKGRHIPGRMEEGKGWMERQWWDTFSATSS